MTETTTGIGANISRSIAFINEQDYEGALGQLFSAMDATGKAMGFKKTRQRICGFIDHYESLIIFLWSGGQLCFFTGGHFLFNGGQRLSKVLYEQGRCPLIHECEVQQLAVSSEQALGGPHERFLIPERMLWAFALCIVAEPNNSRKRLPKPASICYRGFQGVRVVFDLNSMWGKLEKLKEDVGFLG